MTGFVAGPFSRMAGIVCLLIAGAGLAACVTASPEELRRTLTGGFVYSDDKRVADISEIRKDKPVALFLHGCAGFNSNRQFDNMWMISKQVFEVVAPDSFVRAKDRDKCRGRTTHYRIEEIDYAIARIREVSARPIVLVGFSEGGRAVAEYSGSHKIHGKAILAYDCFHGLRRNAPILNIQGRFDREIERGNDLCPVGNSHHVNAGHNVADDPRSMQLLQDFMSAVIR